MNAKEYLENVGGTRVDNLQQHVIDTMIEFAADQNRIYSSIIGLCESLENDGVYKGNGHHLAQKLTALIVKDVK